MDKKTYNTIFPETTKNLDHTEKPEAKEQIPTSRPEANQASEQKSDGKPELYNSRGRKLPLKPVRKRNVALSVIFSVLAYLIYPYFWLFEISKDSKAITKDDSGAKPCLVVLFTIITFGIYGAYWAHKTGQKQESFYRQSGASSKNLRSPYLVLSIIGLLSPILISGLVGALLQGLSPRVALYATLFLDSWGYFIFAMIVLGMMQHHNNAMLEICKQNGRSEIWVKNSSILNRPFLSTVLIVVGANVIIPMGEKIGSMIAEAIHPLELTSEEAANAANGGAAQSALTIIHADEINYFLPNIFSIVFALLILLVFVLLFKNYKYKGVLHVKHLGKALLLCIPGFLTAGMNLVSLFIVGEANISWGVVLFGFVPGFVEEVTYRGVVIPNLLRIFNSAKGIYIALFGSSIIFGCAHLMNISAGADVGTSFFQAFYTFSFGMCAAAVLIRTGNLWASILAHGLMDALACMSPEALEQGAIQTQAFELSPDVLVTAALSICMIVFAIIYVRKSKHGEILSLWRSRFNGAMLEPR